jgi:hypothetical protein
MTQAAPSLPDKPTPRGRIGKARPVTRRAPSPTPHGWRESNLPLRATIADHCIARQLARVAADPNEAT